MANVGKAFIQLHIHIIGRKTNKVDIDIIVTLAFLFLMKLSERRVTHEIRWFKVHFTSFAFNLSNLGLTKNT